MAEHDLRLRWPFTLMIAGSSGSGKTILTSRLIIEAETTMTEEPKQVMIFYSHEQGAYDRLREECPYPVVMWQGAPPPDLETEPGTLLVIDDLQSDTVKEVAKWFTVKSHHNHTSVIYIVQNLFDKTPHHRTISLNASYIVLFKSPRDGSQITHLAKQTFPSNPRYLVDAYRSFTQGKAHSYVVLDFKQSSDDRYRLRDSLFPYSDFPTYGYGKESTWPGQE